MSELDKRYIRMCLTFSVLSLIGLAILIVLMAGCLDMPDDHKYDENDSRAMLEIGTCR